MATLPSGGYLVTERSGHVIYSAGEGSTTQQILDLGGRMAGLGGEKGLLGIELHPSFSENRRLFLRYSAAPADPSADYSHDAVLAEYELPPGPGRLDPAGERRILTVEQPGGLHNAGDLAFGPDGYLYVPFGDGRRTDTNDPDDGFWWYEQGQTAQNTRDNLLGGIVRIDVDEREDDREYGIPDTNPLVGAEGRDEYYAWGLRNPYRISFDGSDLFIADVGEHIREAVYLGEAGANYGWPIFEGSTCGASVSLGHTLRESPLNAFNPKTWVAQTNRISPLKVCPASDELTGAVHDPIVEYHRAGARAITGGHVYRGEALPSLSGQYVFGDYISPAPLFTVDTGNPSLATRVDAGDRPLAMTELEVVGTDHGRLEELLVSFGRDGAGELYVLTTQGAPGTGRVQRLVHPD